MEALRSLNTNQLGLNAGDPNKRFGQKPLRKPRNVAAKGGFQKENLQLKAPDKENLTQHSKDGKAEKLGKVGRVQSIKTEPNFEDLKVLDTVAPQLLQSLPEAESHSSKQLPEGVENIDAEDTSNPQLVSRYVNDIYCYLRKLEAMFPIKKLHLQMQSEITGKMRAVLVDWLVQVHLRFHLLQETLYMTVSILDRYLQAEYVKRSELQLVGITALFIASKFEEMYAPEIGDCVYITDNTYSKEDIFKMERKMLRKLDFNLSKPLPLHFLRRNSKAGDVDSTMHTLAKYLMEIVLPEYEMAHVRPSLLAAAALYLSQRLLTDLSWSATLKYYSNYSEEELLPTARSLCKIVMKADTTKLKAVYSKYSSSKFLKISTIPQLKSPLVKELAGAQK